MAKFKTAVKKIFQNKIINKVAGGRHLDFLMSAHNRKSPYFTELSHDDCASALTKLIAFYLPQFHTFKENDEWHGRGFTEWTNVTKAVPQFTGHHQPHLPIDVGFYDLSSVAVMKRQAELAKKYGLFGFCFHYYWFSGRRLMDRPIMNWLENKDIDFPFCFCWANENWSKLWDGGDKEILLKQELLDDDDEKFFNDILPFFKDDRYIKVSGKPVLIVYNPRNFAKERFVKFTNVLRKKALENGLDGLFLIASNAFNFEENPKDWGLDALVEFPPHGKTFRKKYLKKTRGFLNPNFKGSIFNMNKYVREKAYLYDFDYKMFKTLFPGWDNTARKAYSGANVLEISPKAYKSWLKGLIEYTKEKMPKDQQFIFINAWNEWAEGAHLEPDSYYGYAYLQATKEALEEA